MMRNNISIFLVVIGISILSCQKDNIEINSTLIKDSNCLIDRIDESKITNTDKFDLSQQKEILIPIHFNIIHYNKKRDVTDEDLKKQIEVLNKCYSGKDNDGPILINRIFKHERNDDTKIRFILEGVTSKQSNNGIWSVINNFKKNPNPKFAIEGGIDSTNPKKVLNVWIIDGVMVTKEADLQKKSVTVGISNSPETAGINNYDGVVILEFTVPNTKENFRVFSNPITGSVQKITNEKGKNLVHEIGHYLGLEHLVGLSGSCGDDFVSDTPPAEKLHFGSYKLPFKETCNKTSNYQMVNNYMDYANDDVRTLFTKGQVERMWRLSFWGPDAKRKSML